MKNLPNPTIFFVRHGEIADNKNDILPGWRNDALDSKGVAEASKAADKLTDYPIAHIYTSPLKRASQGAAVISKKTGAAVTPTEGLLPWNYGDIAGQPNNAENKKKLETYQNSPDTKTPNGESFNEYSSDRFFPAVDKMRAYVKAHPDAALVASTHSRNMLAVKHALGDKAAPISVDKSQVPNSSILKAEFNDKFPNGFKLSEV